MSTEPPDVALVREEREGGRRLVVRGLTLVLSIPIAFALGLVMSGFSDSFGPMLIAALYTIIGGAVGVVSLGTGVVKMRIASKQLDQIEAARIPQARLLT